jgi:hypothetical protein
MSIGSCTAIVKKGNKIEAHITQGWLLKAFIIQAALKQGKTVFEYWRDAIEGWGKAERTSMTEEDVQTLVNLNRCSNDPNDLAYVVGDGYFVVDFNQEKVFTPSFIKRGDFYERDGGWLELTTESEC